MLVSSNVTMQFGSKPLFENISVKFGGGNRYGLIGANGSGKSTFMKILGGDLEPTLGNVSLDPNERIGKLRQDQFAFEAFTVLDTVIMGHGELWEVKQERDRIYALAEMSEEDGYKVADLEVKYGEMDGYSAEARAGELLLGVGIPVEQHYGPMSEVAPGWKLRVLLAQALFSNPDILLLDEPTNHLDLDMRQALTEALIDFEGALVVVSHDRHLIRSTTDDLYLVHDGKVEPFDGDLEDYQQWLSDSQKQESQSGEAPKESGNSAQARKDQKRREAELRSQTQPLRKEIARLEKEMDKLNAQLASAEEKLGDSELYDASRKAELTECLQQQASAKSGLEECEMAWLEAQEQLERMLQEG